jgi:S1-C subfamily serine protease
MVINDDGLVLTNNHVIEDSTKITATVIATGQTYPATVVGYDKTGDVALIQLQNASGLTAVPIGNSSLLKAGQTVVAMGNAEGQGSITAAAGNVTALTVPPTIAPVSSGALTDGTICGSPAASAGMTGGAVITAVNGQPVTSPDDLTAILARFHPGQVIPVTWVSPSGQRTTSSLHLGAGPPQ